MSPRPDVCSGCRRQTELASWHAVARTLLILLVCNQLLAELEQALHLRGSARGATRQANRPSFPITQSTLNVSQTSFALIRRQAACCGAFLGLACASLEVALGFAAADSGLPAGLFAARLFDCLPMTESRARVGPVALSADQKTRKGAPDKPNGSRRYVRSTDASAQLLEAVEASTEDTRARGFCPGSQTLLVPKTWKWRENGRLQTWLTAKNSLATHPPATGLIVSRYSFGAVTF